MCVYVCVCTMYVHVNTYGNYIRSYKYEYLHCVHICVRACMYTENEYTYIIQYMYFKELKN